uniref:PROP1-like PPR domain-containing protein n=1 Tax=Lotharella globosa TaxID=91324 RepID=A0A7S3Z8Q9_9EUKA
MATAPSPFALRRHVPSPPSAKPHGRWYSSAKSALGKEELLSQFQTVKAKEVRERIMGVLLGHDLNEAEFMLLMYTTQLNEEHDLTIALFKQAQSRVKMTRPMLHVAIGAFGKEGMFETCLDLFEEFEDHCPRDRDTYAATIIALSKSPDPQLTQRAFEIFDDIEAVAGYIPDLTCYHGVLQTCKETGQWQKALKLLGDMEDHGLKPDATAVVLAIGSCGKGEKEKGKADAAEMLFKSMSSNGLVRDEASYEAFILALEVGGKHTQAIDVFNDIQKRGLMWTVPIYNSIMRILGQMGLFEAGQELFDKMPITGLQPDAGSYAAFMKCCCRGGELEKAEEKLEDAQDAGISPTAEMYEGLIIASAANAQKEKAIEYLTRIQIELKAQPTMHAYAKCMEVCGHCRDWHSAAELFKECITDPEMEPGLDLFNKVIYAVGMGGQLELAESLVEEMRKRKITPDVETYNYLIVAAGEAKEAKRAVELFDEIVDMGMARNDVTYARMIQACEGSDVGDDMFKVYKRMFHTGFDDRKFEVIVAEQTAFEKEEAEKQSAS